MYVADIQEAYVLVVTSIFVDYMLWTDPEVVGNTYLV